MSTKAITSDRYSFSPRMRTLMMPVKIIVMLLLDDSKIWFPKARATVFRIDPIKRSEKPNSQSGLHNRYLVGRL